jgi:tetratricopeptide (TPR) repeat protein
MSNCCELQMRNLYGERKKMQIELAQMFATMGFMHSHRGELEHAIKYFKKNISLIEEDHQWAMGVSSNFANLAVCYELLGQRAKSIEYFQKAYKVDLCVDIEHFKMLHSATNDITFLEEALKSM